MPVKSHNLELQAAGLGRKKVVFSDKGQAIQFSKKLEAAYPKLKAGCGFEILYCITTSNRILCSLPEDHCKWN